MSGFVSLYALYPPEASSTLASSLSNALISIDFIEDVDANAVFILV